MKNKKEAAERAIKTMVIRVFTSSVLNIFARTLGESTMDIQELAHAAVDRTERETIVVSGWLLPAEVDAGRLTDCVVNLGCAEVTKGGSGELSILANDLLEIFNDLNERGRVISPYAAITNTQDVEGFHE